MVMLCSLAKAVEAVAVKAAVVETPWVQVALQVQAEEAAEDRTALALPVVLRPQQTLEAAAVAAPSTLQAATVAPATSWSRGSVNQGESE